ncbi:MAG: steroid delta-isomerase [bacterium]|nr:steroid delta-isomerase [Deltaproteobacteria bacterium]MCP4905836.1 steroid delta-isomerase [bacterium]
MNEEHPALAAARSSWKAAMASDKSAWLGLMADDIHVEDPIGVAPTNPDGAGVHGKTALADFWEKNIGPNSIKIEARDSRTAGMESAHHLTLTMKFSNGVTSVVSGIFTYKVNEAGKLTNLRGYWDMADMAFEQPKGR